MYKITNETQDKYGLNKSFQANIAPMHALDAQSRLPLCKNAPKGASLPENCVSGLYLVFLGYIIILCRFRYVPNYYIHKTYILFLLFYSSIFFFMFEKREHEEENQRDSSQKHSRS